MVLPAASMRDPLAVDAVSAARRRNARVPSEFWASRRRSPPSPLIIVNAVLCGLVAEPCGSSAGFLSNRFEAILHVFQSYTVPYMS
jgi:hypothetical protein